MADRYEPKVSVRPLSERRPAQTSAENDPLVELARIVTGRTPLDAPSAGKAKPAASPGGDGDLSRDLESELLSDLQASFTTIREAVAAAPPPPPAPPPQPKPQAAAPAASRPRSEVPVRERVVQRPVQVPAPPTLAADPAPEMEAEKLPVRPLVTERTERPPPVLRAPSQPAARPPATPPPSRAEFSNPRNELPAFLRTPRGESPPRPDPGSASLRATPPPRAPEPTVRPSSRWKRPEEPRPPHAETGRAITNRAAPPRHEPSESEFDAMSDEIDDGVGFADEEFPVDQGGPFEDDFALEDLQTTGYGADDDLPPFPEDELASLGRRRSKRTFAAIGAVVAIVVAGGLGVYLFRADSATGTPPIIAADATPTKVAPDETATGTGGETDPQAKLIYDRVDDGKAADQTTLVTPGDEPIADIPPIPEETAANPISRVIIPGGPGIDGPIAETATDDPAAEDATGDTATADGKEAPIGPRKVRTVVVRPDGTIVSSEATAVDDNGNVPAPAVPDPTDPALTVQSDRTQMDDVLEGQSLPVNPDPLGSQPVPSDAPAGTVPAAEAVPEPPATASDAANTEAFPDPPAATPADPPATEVASNDNPDAAIDLTPKPPVKAKPKPKAPAPDAAAAPTGGGTLVQISSQRSEEAARSTFRDLQARYPSILGTYKPNIQRADLGDRGVYYRVRVGPFAGNDAARLCESLKSAGGDCIVAR